MARHRHLLGLTIPAYETHCWKWQKVPLNYNVRYAYANGVFVAAEDLDVFRLGVVVTGGRLSHQATCSF
jgi:hypothetical protein